MHDVVTIDGLYGTGPASGLTVQERGAVGLAAVYGKTLAKRGMGCAGCPKAGVGGLLDDIGSFFGFSGTTPNPAYQATAAITGQQVDPSAPADTAPATAPAASTPTATQSACSYVPSIFQSLVGCANANVTPAPGTSVPTAPGAGVNAQGQTTGTAVCSLFGLPATCGTYLLWGGAVLVGLIFLPEIKAALAAGRRVAA